MRYRQLFGIVIGGSTIYVGADMVPRLAHKQLQLFTCARDRSDAATILFAPSPLVQAHRSRYFFMCILIAFVE